MDDERPDHYTDLKIVLRRSEEKLQEALLHARSPFRTMVCATHSPDGYPQARSLILRDFDSNKRKLTFFTDIRTPKVDQITRDNRVSLIAYDPEERIQIRLSGIAAVSSKEENTRQAWELVPPEARQNYRSDSGPGTVLTSPSAAYSGPEEKAFENFATLLVTVMHMDWLYLHRLGNRRAKFTWAGPEEPFREPSHCDWIVP